MTVESDETTPLTPGPGRHELARQRPPTWMIYFFLVATVATWIPLVVFARTRVVRTDATKIRLFMDMDNQPKYKAQDYSQVFADGREMRPKIEGTVARGHAQQDDHYYRGFKPAGPSFSTSSPPRCR